MFGKKKILDDKELLTWNRRISRGFPAFFKQFWLHLRKNFKKNLKPEEKRVSNHFTALKKVTRQKKRNRFITWRGKLVSRAARSFIRGVGRLQSSKVRIYRLKWIQSIPAINHHNGYARCRVRTFPVQIINSYMGVFYTFVKLIFARSNCPFQK